MYAHLPPTPAPAGFRPDTRIETLTGLTLAQDLVAGTVLASLGQTPLIFAATKPQPPHFGPARLPLRVAAHSFGPGLPAADLHLSQHHHILVAGAALERHFGLTAALAPAIGFLDFQQVTIEHDAVWPQFLHLNCTRHGLILAEGLALETGPAPLAPCLPRLTTPETRLLARHRFGGQLMVGAPESLAPGPGHYMA